MTKKTIKNDVLEIDAEEIPLEETITKELVKHNLTDTVIAGLKDKYGELKLKSLEDKESYLELKESRKVVRQYGILTERICRKGRESAIQIQKLWISKEKEVLGRIAEIQDPLDSEIEKYETEQERKAQELAQRREEAYMKRQQQLLKYGATYESGTFVLNHISYESVLIKDSDESIWAETILPKYQKEYEKNESVRVAEEKKREEEAAKLKAEREALEEQQRIFREQQESFQKQQQEAQRLENERLDAIRKANEEADRKVRMELEARSKERSNQLQSLGMSFNFQHNSYIFQDVNVHSNEITTATPDGWSNLIETITPLIEDRKADAEVKRQEEIKQREKEAGERAVAAEQEKQRLLAEKIELERKRAEAQQAEELAKSSDKVKWEYFIKQIQGVVIPEFKSSVYKNKMQSVINKVREIVNL